MNFLTSFKGFLLCILLVSMILNSCDKEIEVDLGSSKGQIVVEGSIQQEYPAYVFLTKSENYFNQVNINTIDNISVNDAEVYIERNDGVIHKLTHISSLDTLMILDSLMLPIKGLYMDVNYQQDQFSQAGYQYKLYIYWKGDTITSTTSIPPQYPIDSVWVERKDTVEDQYKCYIWARLNDPDTINNSILVHYKRDIGWKPMDPLFIPTAISVRSDNLLNGESHAVSFARSGRFDEEDGVLLPFYADREADGNFVRKDIVMLRISHMDYDSFKFWRSVERNQSTNGNPFAEPMNLYSNIKGGLGIWGGYGVSYFYIPIVADTVIYETYNDVDVLEIF
ncbi:MAG: DUF4249 family protein [Flavobacteriales bacterium]|nr:DUF4249 family protein [Flavobacteriales bacterium]